MKRSGIILSVIIIAVLSIVMSGCSEKNGVSANVKDAGGESATPGKQMKVEFIDVGQGDSELIMLPDGKTILIDGGSKGKSDEVMAELDKQKVKSIDYLFVTHAHEDHIGGLPDIIRNYDIGSVYMQKASTNTAIFRDLLQSIKDKGETIKTIREGQLIIDDKDLKLSLQAFNEKAKTYSDMNNYSIVLRLVYGKTSYLFMGDAFTEIEKKLIADNDNLKSDVLKVSHHGSSYGSSLEFLKEVDPRYAVVSVGENNRYDHPHQETVDKLKGICDKVFYTDENGTVTSTSDGVTLTIKGAR
jgi:competence protein ComEC